ncbi:hypothetical protein GQ44DRAFT_765897 [Phaeosphaeriaceae sp. PMI808]|nr:hypothetical protein GQ44DRAFT_765897 [Phaeosphaeriaceae sp. PMI808]
MFKAQLLRRNFSLFRRVPTSRIVRAAASDGHELVTIQRVRFRQPFFTESRIVGALSIAIVLNSLYRYLGTEIKVEVETAHGENNRTDGVDEAEDDDGDDAILFLPTGFSRPVPEKRWEITAQERQEYLRIVTDKERVLKLRDELVALVKTSLQTRYAKNPKTAKIDVKIGRVWFSYGVPRGSLTEYERPGVELTQDLEWRKATRLVGHHVHHRLERLLDPAPVWNALCQDIKRKIKLSWKNFQAYIGGIQNPEPNTIQTALTKVSTSPPPPPSPVGATSPNSSSSHITTTTNSKQSSNNPSSLESQTKDLKIIPPSTKQLTLNLAQFRQDFIKSSKRLPIEIPRGAFEVYALVEIHGTSQMVIDASLMYDPKRGKFISCEFKQWHPNPSRN